MHMLAQITGWLLLTIFAIFANGNLLGVLSARLRRGSFSMLPLIGGVCGMGGCWLLGWPWKWCLACLVIDIGCAPMLVALAVHLALRRMNVRKP